jgi:DNA polymerase III alpha subunit (gram-positive type)
MINDTQIYVVVDIETDGPVPGIYSMLSIGAVASTSTEEVSSFYRKITPLSGAQQYQDTMDWWSKNPDAWQEATTDAQEASVVMRDFCQWVNSLGMVPVFVASPLVFDFGFVNWYIEKFTDANPFMDYSDIQRTLDLASFTAGKLNLPLSRSRSSQIPERFLTGMPEHSHKAIDDARGYGVILRNLLKI